MEYLSDTILMLCSKSKTKVNKAKEQIDKFMESNPNNFLLELHKICLDPEENEDVVAKSAHLIWQKFWR